MGLEIEHFVGLRPCAHYNPGENSSKMSKMRKLGPILNEIELQNQGLHISIGKMCERELQRRNETVRERPTILFKVMCLTNCSD